MLFRRLSTKLTIVFAGVFAAAMAAMATATYAIVTERATAIVAAEMRASGAVFHRLWLDREKDLQEDVALLAKDFGFRAALASEDAPTIASALENLLTRLELDGAVLLDADGRPTAGSGDVDAAAFAPSEAALNQRATGVAFLGSRPYQVGAAPLLAPDLIGWIVFAGHVDQRELEHLQALSPIKLAATVLNQAPERIEDPEDPPVFIQDGVIVVEEALPGFGAQGLATLRLSYPLKAALAPYDLLLSALVGLILLGAVSVSGAIWFIARRISAPISALAAAAARMRDGEEARVAVATNDEFADLGRAFNAMSDGIRDREREIRRFATTDRETELPNRAGLEALIETLPAGDAVVVAIGLERFNPIRDAIGYRLVADLTRLIGDRLADESDVEMVAALSTGVLAVALRGVDDDGALAVARRLQAGLERPIELGAHKIDVMVAVGLARVGGPIDVIDRAVIALEQAREARVGARFFDAEAYGDPALNLSLMGDLLAGMDGDEVTVAYQPKYDLRSASAIGVEALVRWTHPVRGFVPPDAFIPLAEETGRIGALTLHVMRRAMAAQADLKAQGFDLEMSINLSGRLLGDHGFEAAILPMVADAVGPVWFEITETAVIEDPEKGLAAIERYAEAGVRISIDDYGSGLSSLAYLKQIPAQELKIDKAFVLEVHKNARDALLVRSTVDLAHSLGMKVTAEGVETAQAAALLAGMGCDVGQGYGLGRPMPLAKLVEHLRSDEGADLAYDTPSAGKASA